jgi:hypothetical protein
MRARRFTGAGYRDTMTEAALRHPEGPVLSMDPAVYDLMVQHANNFVRFRCFMAHEISGVRDASLSAILHGYQLGRYILRTLNSERRYSTRDARVRNTATLSRYLDRFGFDDLVESLLGKPWAVIVEIAEHEYETGPLADALGPQDSVAAALTFMVNGVTFSLAEQALFPPSGSRSSRPAPKPDEARRNPLARDDLTKS